MTHLSDFSYLQRSVTNVYITAYLVYSIWNNDRFRCMQPARVLSGELRSIITVLMFTMMTTQTVWDIVSTCIKYREGFAVLSNGHIVQKPFEMWSPENQKPIQPIDYIQCITFAFHTGVFFLMQCFWNYLSNSVAKRTFMGSFEFKFYILWGLGSVAMFPVLQWRFRGDPLLSEVVPQLAYGCEVLITACLGIRSDLRFKRLISYSRRNQDSSTAAIVARLTYFREMNVLLTIVLFIYGTCFIILCADGLTDAMVINSNKFACDVLIANVNLCTVFLWMLFISIFHPRRNYSQNNAPSTAKSESGVELGTKEEMSTGERSRNGRPLSTRVINYMANKQNSSSDYNQGTMYNTHTGNASAGYPTSTQAQINTNGTFMRPMSPVNVDYPPSSTMDTTALPSSSGYYARNMAVQDPYSSEPIQFSMLNHSASGQEHYSSANRNACNPTPESHIQAGRQLNSRGPSPMPTHYGDQERAGSPHGYHQDMSQSHRPTSPGQERMMTDWLHQSPERKNY